MGMDGWIAPARTVPGQLVLQGVNIETTPPFIPTTARIVSIRFFTKIEIAQCDQ